LEEFHTKRGIGRATENYENREPWWEKKKRAPISNLKERRK